MNLSRLFRLVLPFTPQLELAGFLPVPLSAREWRQRDRKFEVHLSAKDDSDRIAVTSLLLTQST